MDRQKSYTSVGGLVEDDDVLVHVPPPTPMVEFAHVNPTLLTGIFCDGSSDPSNCGSEGTCSLACRHTTSARIVSVQNFMQYFSSCGFTWAHTVCMVSCKE